MKQYPEAMQVDGMLMMRIDSPIYFANVAPIREALKYVTPNVHQAVAVAASCALKQS